MTGIWNNLHNGNTGVLNNELTLSMIEDTIKEIFSKKQTPYRLHTGGYGMALLNNDKKEIAYYKAKMKSDNIERIKILVTTFGIKKARVLEWLNKKNIRSSYNIHENIWHFTNNKWIYKNVSDGELDTIIMSVVLLNDKFSIQLRADTSDGYNGYEHNIVLSKDISFNSIINQVRYISKKLQSGML